MKQNVKSVVIVGVGGQGTLLASRVLAALILKHRMQVNVHLYLQFVFLNAQDKRLRL